MKLSLIFLSSVLINLSLGLILGFKLSKKGIKNNKKNIISITFLSFIINNIRIIFLGIGTVVSLLATILNVSPYGVVKDVVVNILGFTGLLFTFLMGNSIKNKSDYEKSVIELEIKKEITVNIDDQNTYCNKIEEIMSSLKRNDKYMISIFQKGLFSIIFYIMSIVGLVIQPLYNNSFGNLVDNLIIFWGFFLGLNFLLELFIEFESVINEEN